MITAHDVRKAAFLRHGGKIFVVLDQSTHVGGGKAGGTVHLKLRDVASGHAAELKLDPHEKLEDLDVQRRPMRFLYMDGDQLCFMDPQSFEQISLDKESLGHLTAYLQEELEVTVEFFEGAPIHVTPPERVAALVAETAPPMAGNTENVFKPAKLSTGAEILVPPFIKAGDRVLVHVETGKYVERVKE